MEIEEEKEKENSNKNDNMKDNDEIDENFVEVAGVLIDEENILLNSEEIENFSMYTIKKAKLKQILKVKFTLCDEILLNIFKDYFQFKQIGFNEYLICDQINLKIHKN